MFSLTIIAAVIFCLWLYLLWERRKYYFLAFKLPGPSGYPLFGMALKFRNREDILRTLEENEKIYGSLIFSWLGTKPFLVVSEPQIVQDIFTSPYCVNKGNLYQVISDGTGPGLFSLKDPYWSIHRKLLNPAFKHKVLASFVPIFNKESNRLLRNLDDVCGSGEVNIMKIVQKFTLSVATSTTMGFELRDERREDNKYILDCYQRLLECFTMMCFSPWLRYSIMRKLFGIDALYKRSRREIRKFIAGFIDRKTNEAAAQRDTNMLPSEKHVFINLAIDLQKRGDFSKEDVEYESNVVVFGAFETTANAISYTLMLLAMFPNYQQKLFEEILSVFPDRDNLEVTIADTQHLVFMDLVLNEVMRVMAPVPVVVRETSAEVKLSNGVVLPKGVQVAVDIFNMQRRKDIWGPEADKFNPENFLPSNLESKHPYAFIPFTKGIRNCIGWRYALLSLKIVLTKLVRNYQFKTNFNFQDLHFVEDITLKLKKTPLLELRRRDI